MPTYYSLLMCEDDIPRHHTFWSVATYLSLEDSTLKLLFQHQRNHALSLCINDHCHYMPTASMFLPADSGHSVLWKPDYVIVMAAC